MEIRYVKYTAGAAAFLIACEAFIPLANQLSNNGLGVYIAPAGEREMPHQHTEEGRFPVEPPPIVQVAYSGNSIQFAQDMPI